MSGPAQARLLSCGALIAVSCLTMSLTSCSGPGPVDPSTDVSPQSFSVPTVAPRKTHYVSPTGNDVGPGTADSPWKTIQFALTRTFKGEVLYVHGGTYKERVEKPHLHNGSEAQPIYVANVPGERPVIKGFISLIRPEYWNFSGLNVTWDPELTNPPSFMVKITGGLGWSWRNSEFSGSLASGNMFVGVATEQDGDILRRWDPQNWTLENNCFHDLRSATDGNAANLVLGAMRHPGLGTIERNLFFNRQNQDNITLGSASGAPRRVVLRYNTIYGGRFALTLSGSPRNIRITRNLLGGASSDVLVRFDNSYSRGTKLFQNLAVDAGRLMRPRAETLLDGLGNVLLPGAALPAQTTTTTGPTGATSPSTSTPVPPMFSATDGCDGFHTDLPEALPYGRDAL